MRLILAALLALFVGLQYSIWLGDFGYLRLDQLREAVSNRIEDNARFEARNLRLQAEVIDLKQGTAALEERARSQLGMVKKDEVFYQIVD